MIATVGEPALGVLARGASWTISSVSHLLESRVVGEGKAVPATAIARRSKAELLLCCTNNHRL